MTARFDLVLPSVALSLPSHRRMEAVDIHLSKAVSFSDIIAARRLECVIMVIAERVARTSSVCSLHRRESTISHGGKRYNGGSRRRARVGTGGGRGGERERMLPYMHTEVLKKEQTSK